jgi:hypothetical protein
MGRLKGSRNVSTHLKRAHAGVKADDQQVYVYFDVVRIWLKQPLSQKEWGWVNGQVGTPLLGYPFNIQQGRRQRLILTQPSEACLRFFADLDGQINHVELALDIITPHASELKQAALRGFVQRRHLTKQGTIFTKDDANFRTGDLGCRGTVFQATGLLSSSMRTASEAREAAAPQSSIFTRSNRVRSLFALTAMSQPQPWSLQGST